MKKLVTIVSAVMMLLMLAACAPGLTVNAEQAAAVAKATVMQKFVSAYMAQEKIADNDDISFEVKEDTVIESVEGYKNVKILAGSTYSEKTTGTTDKTTTYDVDVKFTWDTLNEKNEIDESIEGSYVMKGSITLLAESNLETCDIDFVKVDGVGYEPALFF